ncbi:hypothetical protein F5144DRAFT_621651 [Chaetomium tenue]|uniref:Uncharacterized protein n=1 Tax=Chaetomium tenue TaxID=1854479 RepID=A0ACB7P2R9_9PEZI|nr:hypothetical protein F5144DRAFT_621651 [Chaetomium globosum]
MARLRALLGAVLLACNVNAAPDYTDVCQDIASQLSEASEVVYPIQFLRYTTATQHWFRSSNGDAACVVEVGSVEDVSLVLEIVGASSTPFAVYSGGHSSNPGFSSTTGVHITLKRLNQVDLSEDKKIVTLGFGQGWADVYDALDGTGVSVVGGRVPGPGVGGFTLGGGYSWYNGTVTIASDDQNQDLFFALRGGLNRYGIVTSAEFYTHPQPAQVWGGLRAYPSSQIPALLNATQRFFEESKDPKAQIITTFDGSGLGVTSLTLFFYDGPEKPEIFDMFDGMLTTLDNTGKKSYKKLINSFPAEIVLNARGTFGSFSTTRLTNRFNEAVKQEVEDIGKISALHGGTMVSYEIEPFIDYGKHAKPGAFPHADSLLPLNLYFAWAKESDDEWWYATARQSLARLKQVAKEEGIYEDTFLDYSNYVFADTPAEKMYGVENTKRLRQIRDQKNDTMFYQPGKTPHNLPYDPFKACVIPRPIGWISTTSPLPAPTPQHPNPQPSHNLAPYSQFAPLTFDPPYVLFSANQTTHSGGGARKDTVRNVEATGKFAWSLATYALREAVNATARPVGYGVDEFEVAGLEKEFSSVLPGDGDGDGGDGGGMGNPVPMVKASPVKFECVYHSTVRLPGHGPVGSVDVVIGRVVGVHIAEWALDGRGRLDVRKTRPIARCGYFEYAVVGGEGTIFEMVIPGADEVMLAALQGDKKGVAEGLKRVKAKL